MPSESEILTAIGNGGLIEGIDPLYSNAKNSIRRKKPGIQFKSSNCYPVPVPWL